MPFLPVNVTNAQRGLRLSAAETQALALARLAAGKANVMGRLKVDAPFPGPQIPVRPSEGSGVGPIVPLSDTRNQLKNATVPFLQRREARAGRMANTTGTGVGWLSPVLTARGSSITGFRSPKLVKGRLTNLRTRYYREFMFNPTEVEREDAWEWGAHRIPGASHPVISGGSGGPRLINFTVFLDGDRGSKEKRNEGVVDPVKFQPVGDAFPIDTTTFGIYPDVTDDINFWRQFTHPMASGQNTLANRGPAHVVFTYGPLFPGVECVVRRCKTRVMMWTPKLLPMRATVEVQLEEFVSQSVLAREIFTGDVGVEAPFTASAFEDGI